MNKSVIINSKSILVVDDVAINRLLPGLILRPFGWSVYESSGGLGALSVMAEVQVSCVLLDISMPDVSGLDVLADLRRNSAFKKVRFIAYTAYAQMEDVSYLISLGFDFVLIKPLTSAKLLELFELN